jgi:hypothetical protein
VALEPVDGGLKLLEDLGQRLFHGGLLVAHPAGCASKNKQ